MINKLGVEQIENKMYNHYKQFNLSYNAFFYKRINRPRFNSILLETTEN